MTVKTISNDTPREPSPHNVEAINKIRVRKPGKVIAAISLKSRDVLVIAYTPSTKALLEQDTTWKIVIAGKLCNQGHRFIVIAYAVKVSRVDQNEQAKLISNIESQNPTLKSSITIVSVTGCLKHCTGARPAQLKRQRPKGQQEPMLYDQCSSRQPAIPYILL
jgi:hypothetical protein